MASDPKNRALRIPPGQTEATQWPVLHYAEVVRVDKEQYRFKTLGEIDRPLDLTLEELLALPSVALTADFHCVTTWSTLDNHWQGVRFREIAARSGMRPTARHVMAHSCDGYYTNVPLRWLMEDDVLLAWAHNGAPLSAEHGGPVRLVVPKLYAWKSAKWLCGLEFMVENRRGYWEERGYHNIGEPFAEERYSHQETGDER